MSKSLHNFIALIAPALLCARMGAADSQPLPVSPNQGADRAASRIQMSSAATSPAPLEGSTGYPRVLRLMDPPGAPKGRLLASSRQRLYTSDDDGAKWRPAMTMPNPPGLQIRCCETLFQLPKPVGAIPAGTLLYAASYLRGSTPAIGYFASSNDGRTWNFQGTPVLRGNMHHGLWEPEFEIAQDGALVMFWSDETDSAHSQKLAQMRTYDGRHWQDGKDTVASDIQRDRPGMAVVSRLPDGHFFMTYEMVGPTAHGAVYARISDDGWNFGNPAYLGFRPTDHAGEYFRHTPVNAWAPLPGGSNGAILMVGRTVAQKDGSRSPFSGRVLFMNTSPDGAGPWTKLRAPVQVLNITKRVCQNYSSALLPASDGRTVLELAGADAPDGRCMVFAGRGNLPLK